MLKNEPNIYKFRGEVLAAPFYAKDFHFMPSNTFHDEYPLLEKTQNPELSIFTTLKFSATDIADLLNVLTKEIKVKFVIPIYGHDKAHDFFFGFGEFHKFSAQLDVLIRNFPNCKISFKYQINNLTAAVFEDFKITRRGLQHSHPKIQFDLELIFNNRLPSYLSLDLVKSDWPAWLGSEANISSQKAHVNVTDQILAAFYYSIIMKRAGFSPYNIFPKAQSFLKQSAAAFLSVRPRILDTLFNQEEPAIYQQLLLKKESTFLKTDISGLSKADKEHFLKKFYSIKNQIKCAHSDLEMLDVMIEILSLNERREGVILEAGVFKGGATARLSLASSLKSRKLLAFDSFCGLPSHDESSPGLLFPEGSYLGTKEEVAQNLKMFGEPDCVELIEGWFSETLPKLKENVALAFIDVDLSSSTQVCLKYIWPKLIGGGVLYSHDAHFSLVNEIFINPDFWMNTLGSQMPKIEAIAGSHNLVKLTKL